VNALNHEVTLRDSRIPSSARDYLEEKLQRLDRLHQHAQGVRAVLSLEREIRRVELIVVIEHHSTLVVEERDPDLLAAIDRAVDRMDRLLAKEKDKRIQRSRRGRGAPEAPPEV